MDVAYRILYLNIGIRHFNHFLLFLIYYVHIFSLHFLIGEFLVSNWRIPSFFLLLLTSFSCEQFRIPHNVLAICFYFACLYSLFKNKRLKFYRVLYILSIPFYFYSIILGEIIGVLTLCSFHLQIVVYKEKLDKLKIKIVKEIEEDED